VHHGAGHFGGHHHFDGHGHGHIRFGPVIPYGPYYPYSYGAPGPSHWYYCPSHQAYYPYVTSCPDAW
jgi:hypothetical protein